MIQKMRTLLLSLALVVGLGGPVLVPALPVLASESSEAACKGIGLTGSRCGDAAEGRVRSLLATIVSILSIVVGVVAVVMIIISGLKYITSNGDSNNITSAKNTLVYAIVGLIIVALAQFIVRFVLGAID